MNYRLKPLLSLIACLSCITITATAQKFYPGYYISLSGDTVRSDMYIQKRFNSPTAIQLKNGTVLGPLAVRGFGTRGANFITKIVTVDKTPVQVTGTDTTFLEVLVRGKISLLYYRDSYPKAHFFIEHEDNSLEELGLKILDLGDHKQFSKLTTYMDVLKNNFPTCTDLFPEIDKTTYDRFGIQQIFLKLYKCKYTQEVPGYVIKKSGYMEYGLTGGLVYNSISFSNNIFSPYTQLNFSKSVNFTGGVYVNVITPRVPFLIFRNELIFSSYNSSAPETVVNPIAYDERLAAAGLKNSYLRYNLLFRKNFGHKDVLPFINVGGSVSLLLSHSGYQTDIRRIFGTEVMNETRAFAPHYSHGEIGVIGGFGATIRKLSFEARYELSSGIMPIEYATVGGGLYVATLDPDSPVNSIYFIVSYQLGDTKKSKTTK